MHNGWTKGCTPQTRYIPPLLPPIPGPAAHCVMQLGIQFFQISNDGESWKTLKDFDDNLRKKYGLGRVSPAFHRFMLTGVNA